MSSTKFLILYLLFMIPTYFVRFTAIGAALDGGDVENIGGAANFLLFLFLLGLCFVTYLRGKAIGKKHLVAFPIVALVFDLILAFIPLVPTVMHIITLVVGMPEPEGKNESEKI